MSHAEKRSICEKAWVAPPVFRDERCVFYHRPRGRVKICAGVPKLMCSLIVSSRLLGTAVRSSYELSANERPHSIFALCHGGYQTTCSAPRLRRLDCGGRQRSSRGGNVPPHNVRELKRVGDKWIAESQGVHFYGFHCGRRIAVRLRQQEAGHRRRDAHEQDKAL